MPPAAAPSPAPTSAVAGQTTVVAVAAPAAPSMTLPQFLGLDVAFGGLQGAGQRLRNRLGTRFPALEAKPPILAITDPANSSETASPAVQAAAEAKAEADQAPQKIKAVSYLASLGCGKCYPDNEAALLAALEDCSESIRYAAAKGLRKSLGTGCGCCRENSCCSEKLLKKLQQLGYDRDDSGCYVEPSSRVRRYSRLAVEACGCGPVDKEPQTPLEGPSSEKNSTETTASASILDVSFSSESDAVSMTSAVAEEVSSEEAASEGEKSLDELGRIQ